jgi:hypothetical protein
MVHVLYTDCRRNWHYPLANPKTKPAETLVESQQRSFPLTLSQITCMLVQGAQELQRR